jgi:hypothetical protein
MIGRFNVSGYISSESVEITFSYCIHRSAVIQFL